MTFDKSELTVIGVFLVVAGLVCGGIIFYYHMSGARRLECIKATQKISECQVAFGQ